MDIVRQKDFNNGTVYLLKNDQGRLLETTDTFLPFYTKDSVGRHTNAMDGTDAGSRLERWMVGVSVMSGCPVGCKFCATGKMKSSKVITGDDILNQLLFVINRNSVDPNDSREFKINYTRMGEPFLNVGAVRDCIEKVDNLGIRNAHHYVSTMGIAGSDFSWIEGNISLQISLHSTDEGRRDCLIPYKNKMTIKELGQIRTKSNRKTTINMTLIDRDDFDVNVLRETFDPEFFFVKLSPINKNSVSVANDCGDGVIRQSNTV